MTTAPSEPGARGDGSESAEHFRNGIEAAPIGIVCVDGPKGRYVFANETFANMIGRPRDEVMRSDPFQIAFEATHPDDRLKSRQAIESVAQGVSDTLCYEKRLVRADGAQRWVSVQLSARRDTDGRLAFLTFYFTDIQAVYTADAARAQLAAQLRQARKLESLGRLAGGVAHDFNNRLLIIMGHTELLKNGLPADSPLRSRTELVLNSAQRAGELTRQLLAYGRRQVLKPQAFDLNAVVENMQRLLERLIGHEIELRTSLEASAPILADPGQIEQVIINLALNARDAMPQGGQLTLETRDVTLAGSPQSLPAGSYVTLLVGDSGVGIPEALLPRIFEPFFTTKAADGGTGLGLASVEDIVQQSGGSVRVESEPGAGTTFTIYLPRASRPPAAQPEPLPEAPPVARAFETVLVCDEDRPVRELIANVLKLRGYTVLEASSADQALQLAFALRGPLHLLVTDPALPELGHTELSAQLRAQHPALSVLYISSNAEHTAPRASSPDARTHFLPKPFLPSDLTRSVCAMLETH